MTPERQAEARRLLSPALESNLATVDALRQAAEAAKVELAGRVKGLEAEVQMRALWVVVVDTGGAHEAECVYSVWTTLDGAEKECARLNTSGQSLGCYGGTAHVVGILSDTPHNDWIGVDGDAPNNDKTRRLMASRQAGE